MNKDELTDLYLKKMQAIIDKSHYEPEFHEEMDELLMKLLNDLGFNEVTELYNSTSKWYA
jgi:hypothetical protein